MQYHISHYKIRKKPENCKKDKKYDYTLTPKKRWEQTLDGRNAKFLVCIKIGKNTEMIHVEAASG